MIVASFIQGIFQKEFLISAAEALAVTALLAAALWLMARFWHRGYQHIAQWKPPGSERPKGFVQALIARGRLTGLLKSLFRLLRIAVTLTLIYVWLVFVFRLFPATEGYAAAILDLTLAPLRIFRDSFIAFIPDLFFILVTIALTIFIVKFLRVIFYEIAVGTIKVPGFYSDWAIPTYKLVRFLAVVLAAIVIFPYLPGGKSPAAQGVTIFLGALVSFGSSSAVSNLIAGVILTYTRAFRVGDYVKIGGAIGNVVEKTFLITRIRTVKNETITIPNAMVQGAEVINYTRLAANSHLFLYTSVTIGYDAPWRTVHELLLNAAKETKNILADPPPFVLQTALNDFYVTYEINAATSEPDRMVFTYGELHQHIQDQFNRAGVEIMSPHYTSLRDGNTITVPAAHRAAEYEAPAFRLRQMDSSPGKTRG